jgi:hypothetical protein
MLNVRHKDPIRVMRQNLLTFSLIFSHRTNVVCGYYFGFVVLLVAVKGLQLRFCDERKLDVCFGIDGVFRVFG